MRTNSFLGHVGDGEKQEESDGSALSKAINGNEHNRDPKHSNIHV